MMPEFIDRCVAAASELALFFVGTPEPEMLVALHRVRANIEAELADLGPDVAAKFAKAFVTAVVGHRREIDAAGEMQRVVN